MSFCQSWENMPNRFSNEPSEHTRHRASVIDPCECPVLHETDSSKILRGHLDAPGHCAQVHEGASPYFGPAVLVETFNIDPLAGTTHVGDLCKTNTRIASELYDAIGWTEVLEHTLDPFAAVGELWRMLRPGGCMFMSVPFNFRIDGPLLDCWRFTEHGLRTLFRDWEILDLVPLETPDRFLMPIHYTLIAHGPRNADSSSPPSSVLAEKSPQIL